jgi:hypothetical protein
MESRYMQLIIQRVMLIFLLCVITVPFLMENFYWSRKEMLSHYFDTL